MGLSMCLFLHCVIVFLAIVLNVWRPSVLVEVVSVLEGSTVRYSFHLRVDGPNVWCVMSTVYGCLVVIEALFVFQQSPL